MHTLKKAILVNLDPGMAPTIFIVPSEMLTHEQEEKLERLVELHLGYEIELGVVHEVGSVREVNDILIEDCGQEGVKYPDFDDPVTDEEGAKLMNISVSSYRAFKEEEGRQEAKLKKFGERYSVSQTGRLPGVTTGRFPSNMERSNLPRSGLKGLTLISADFSDFELRIMKQIKEPRTVKTQNGTEVPITWDQCSEGCAGWIHSYDPYEVEQCDECGRFKVADAAVLSDVQELAIQAHRAECGCGWPERDLQNATMAWVRDLIEYDLEDPIHHQASPYYDEVMELHGYLEERGVEFMDNVIHAIHTCGNAIDKTIPESPPRGRFGSLMKLLKEIRDKIDNEELKLKDFGNPPGEEEVHDG